MGAGGPSPFSGQERAFTYFWQVLTTVTGAGVVALWVWVWNTSVAIRDIANFKDTLIAHDVRINGNRTSIEFTEQEIALLKVNLQYLQGDRENIKLALRDMQVDFKDFNAVHQEIIVSLTRLTETVKQLRDKLSINRNLEEGEGPINGR